MLSKAPVSTVASMVSDRSLFVPAIRTGHSNVPMTDASHSFG